MTAAGCIFSIDSVGFPHVCVCLCMYIFIDIVVCKCTVIYGSLRLVGGGWQRCKKKNIYIYASADKQRSMISETFEWVKGG